MCDYSLQNVKSRAAKVDDKLIKLVGHQTNTLPNQARTLLDFLTAMRKLIITNVHDQARKRWMRSFGGPVADEPLERFQRRFG